MLYIVLSLLLCFIIFLYKKSQSFYPYKTSSSYSYKFKSDFTIDYKKQPIDLPLEIEKSDTVFLKLKVKSKWLGYFVQPYIEIESSNGIFKQYTEHGARGFRYINISNIGSQLTIKGKRLIIANQKIEVSIFKNEEIHNKKILFISPHADDAEIAGYGLYSKNPKNTFVLTVSAGEKGYKYRELYTNKEKQHQKKGDIRVWNSLTVPLMANVPLKNILTFGLFNDTLEDMYNDKSKVISSKVLNTDDVTIFTKQNFSPLGDGLENVSNWKSFVKNLEHIIQNFNPDIIATPYPYIDSHEDHQYSTIACIEALKNLQLSKGKLFLYTNHYTDDEYYPHGKMGSIMSVPPKFDNSIYFDSIYSHPLNKFEQIDKILAFDAMNDLRPNTEYRLWYRLFSNGFTRLREKLFSIEKDYFNRYVRSNELFFVVDIKNIYDKKIVQNLMPKNFKDNS